MARVSCPRSSHGWLALTLLFAGCTAAQLQDNGEPLPSWNEGPARNSILAFVAQVTDPAAAGFVEPTDRIAVFDNDGTLIIERPLVQMEFVYERIRTLAVAHPEWRDQPAFRDVLNADRQALDRMSFRGRGELVDAAQAGLYQAEFRAAVTEFLATARHRRFDQPYTRLVYQPMLELIDLLHANDFRVFIVSAGGIEFIRQFAEDVYGVPRSRVIGSVMKYALRDRDGRLDVWRKPGFQSLNAGRFKVLNIDRHIGRRPILAVGNSDGDLQMLRYTQSMPGTLAILLRHDDAEREFAYADDSTRARAAAAEGGWLTVSMARDFGRIFPGDP